LAQQILVVFEKNAKKARLFPKNAVTEPKAKLIIQRFANQFYNAIWSVFFFLLLLFVLVGLLQFFYMFRCIAFQAPACLAASLNKRTIE